MEHSSQKNSLWVQCIHQNYLQNSTIWDNNGRKQDSALMKVLFIRDKILAVEGSMQAVKQIMEQWVSVGGFCSKAAYEFFRPRKGSLTWPKLVWISCITPKHSFILWLGLKDRCLRETRCKNSQKTRYALCAIP